MRSLRGVLLLLAAARAEVLGGRCTAETWARGRWLHTGGGVENATLGQGRGADLWAWQPDCVQDVPSAETELCTVLKLANLRSVLLLGDSISGHHLNNFGATAGASIALWPREKELALSSQSDMAEKGVAVSGRFRARVVCGAESGTRATFIRTDFLSTRLDGYREARGGTSEPWADAQLLANYGVVVVNSGAHHLADAVFEQRMEEAADFLKTHVPLPRVLVYRDIVPGHGDCMNLSRPFGSVDEAERWLQAHPWYTSATVQHQNAAAWRIFERRGFVRLNVYDMSVLRGDAHSKAEDCLHFSRLAAPDIYGAWNAGLALLLRDVLHSETVVARSPTS